MPTRDINAVFSAGISQHLEIELNDQPQTYSRIYTVDTSEAKFEDYQLWEGYGLPGLKNPGMVGVIGSNRQSYGVRIPNQTYYLGDVITMEDWDDDQYGVLHRLIPSKGGAMARAFRTLKEIVHANYIINNGWTATTGLTDSTPDGLSIFNVAHPYSLQNTGTQSNRTSVDADLSIATAQFLSINIANQLAANGVTYLENKMKKVVVNPSQKYVAMQVFDGAWERGTADRNTNYLTKEGIEVIEWPYLKASGAQGVNNSYFGIGTENYLYSIDRTKYRVNTDQDITTESIIFAAIIRFGRRCVDYRGLAGSAGK